ncbi:HNH endonuclease [Ensifer sp. Root954]|nr:HNH endonuclease [Ensifer sp. Root1298]KQX90965.1 HNH endonuclease [Ensifer sp. Root1312]KRC25809.1 HNH endonuclease [Ensifer sp. Root74]KRD73689.1 HNH endonuclease [Ensifer sp. Root954]
MGRLSTLKPRLTTLGSRIARPEGEPARLAERDRNVGWRKWYKTARWQKLRMQVLKRDLFTCQMVGCGRIEANTSQLVADHKIRHQGEEHLFWDENNLQCLCKPCHDRLKQKEERAAARW